MQIFALVDYDNVKPQQKEKASVDVEYNLGRIIRRVTEVTKEIYPISRDVTVRLYGGWTDRANCKTAAGLWIYGAAASSRGRHSGVRVRPEVVVNNIDCDLPQLIGLYRDGGQKMVDTLIVSDLITIATQYSCPVLLLSDDEDMVPGLIAVRAAGRQVTLLRNRQLGEAMNDNLLSSLNIHMAGCF